MLQITTVANDDVQYIPFRIADDSGAGNDTLLQISSTGAIVTATPTTLERAELDRLDGRAGILVTDTTEVTEVDGDSLTINTGTLDVDAASLTITGAVELATTLEIDTATDNGRPMTPGQFEESEFGAKHVEVLVNDSTDLTTGDLTAKFFTVPA